MCIGYVRPELSLYIQLSIINAEKKNTTHPLLPVSNCNNLPLLIIIPNIRAEVFHENTIMTAIYRRHARGQLLKANSQLLSAIAQKDRVNPQNGHGYPVNRRNRQDTTGRKYRGTKSASSNAVPVIRAGNR
jgi:hypothetical protein